MMHDHEKSDRPVLPAKPPNKPGEPEAEVVEGRGLPEGNTAGETRPGRGAGQGVSSDLDRVRQVDSTPKPEGGAQCANAHAGICAGGVGQLASLPRL